MLLHSETLYNALHRSFYKVKPLRRAAFQHRCFYTRTLLRREDFTLKLNREASAHRSRYTEQPLHTEAFRHGSFYTQKLAHTEAFTRRSRYTEQLLHRNFCFTHGSFQAQKLLQGEAVAQSEVCSSPHVFIVRACSKEVWSGQQQQQQIRILPHVCPTHDLRKPLPCTNKFRISLDVSAADLLQNFRRGLHGTRQIHIFLHFTARLDIRHARSLQRMPGNQYNLHFTTRLASRRARSPERAMFRWTSTGQLP